MGAVRRTDTHSEYRHHVGVRRHRDVPDFDGRPVQASPLRTRHGPGLSRAILSGIPGHRVWIGSGLPVRDGLVQWYTDAAVPRPDGARLWVFWFDGRATQERGAR